MKKSKQIKRKLSFEKLNIAKLNNDSKLKIIGGMENPTVTDIGTGSVISTVSEITHDSCSCSEY